MTKKEGTLDVAYMVIKTDTHVDESGSPKKNLSAPILTGTENLLAPYADAYASGGYYRGSISTRNRNFFDPAGMFSKVPGTFHEPKLR